MNDPATALALVAGAMSAAGGIFISVVDQRRPRVERLAVGRKNFGEGLGVVSMVFGGLMMFAGLAARPAVNPAQRESVSAALRIITLQREPAGYDATHSSKARPVYDCIIHREGGAAPLRMRDCPDYLTAQRADGRHARAELLTGTEASALVIGMERFESLAPPAHIAAGLARRTVYCGALLLCLGWLIRVRIRRGLSQRRRVLFQDGRSQK